MLLSDSRSRRHSWHGGSGASSERKAASAIRAAKQRPARAPCYDATEATRAECPRARRGRQTRDCSPSEARGSS
jgi:hypothetical protein